jgi:hypothetical protein
LRARSTQGRKLGREIPILMGGNTAQVKQRGALMNAADDGAGPGTERGLDAMAQPLFLPCKRMARPGDDSRSSGRTPKPICDLRGTIHTVTGGAARAARRAGSRWSGARPQPSRLLRVAEPRSPTKGWSCAASGLLEVLQARGVGGAHLEALRVGALHDVGHVEDAADLAPLAARDYDLRPRRQGVALCCEETGQLAEIPVQIEKLRVL